MLRRIDMTNPQVVVVAEQQRQREVGLREEQCKPDTLPVKADAIKPSRSMEEEFDIPCRQALPRKRSRMGSHLMAKDLITSA